MRKGTQAELTASFKKYSFINFIAARESNDFDNIEPKWLDWAKRFVTQFAENMSHDGDCFAQPCTCDVCLLEMYLQEYREYIFDGGL